MANTLPFTVYLKFVPQRVSKSRWELIRSREKIARKTFLAIQKNIAEINQAMPGGGQISFADIAYQDASGVNWTGPNSNIDAQNSFSNYGKGLALTPQFGEYPDKMTLVGFISDINALQAPAASQTIISNGVVFTGVSWGGHGFAPSTAPSTNNVASAQALKTAIDAALVADPIAANHVDAKVEYIEIAGVKYGNGQITL